MWLWAENYIFQRSAVYYYSSLIFSACKRSENFFNFMRYLDNIPTYQRYSDLRGKVCLLHLGVTIHNTAVCFKWFSFSGGGLVTSYSGEFGGFYLSTVRCAVKSNTSSRRRRQLHKWSDSGTPSQAEWNGLPRRNEMKTGASSSAVALLAMAGQASKASGVWWRCEENLRFWVKSFCWHKSVKILWETQEVFHVSVWK